MAPATLSSSSTPALSRSHVNEYTSTVPSLLDPKALISPSQSPSRILTRAQIAFLITQGHLLVLHRHLVYRMNTFLKFHPGGDLPVMHFVGRDATDEIEAYHPVFALQKMKHYVVGCVAPEDWADDELEGSTGWKPLVPPLHVGWPGEALAYQNVPDMQATMELWEGYAEHGFPCKGSPIGTELPFLSMDAIEPPNPSELIDPVRQHQLSMSFRKLRHTLLQEPNLFDCNPWVLYRSQIIRTSALFTAFVGFYATATTKWHYALSAISLGFWMHQIMFIAHDAGHSEVTGNRFWDRVIGGIIASYASGMSLGWWNSQHNVHHLITNHPEHDPDIQLMPFFAFNNRFFDSMYSTFHKMTMHFDAPSRFLVQYQHILFYPVMIVARFSLFGKSYYFLTMKAKADGFRTFELVGVAFWWTGFITLLKHMGTGLDGWLNRLLFVFCMLVAVCPIHVQIVLSHSAQDSEDVGVYECFVHRQLRTTMDVSCNPLLDWIHGGLHMQVVHHLFPRLSRPNLRRATKLVKVWAIENDIEFKEASFGKGNSEMIGMLSDIAAQCRALMAKTDELAKGVIELH